jgi:hypothetical protein
VTRFIALLVLLSLAACGTGGASYNQEVDDLGKHIVEVVKGDPAVTDASYQYEHGLDLGQHLHITGTVDDPAAAQQVIDKAAETFWLSPAPVYHLTVKVYSGTDATNPIATDDIQDANTFDRPEMEQKYGPRPTRPAGPTR